MPHDGVIYRPAGFPVPEDGGFPLVGDADGEYCFRVNVGGVHRLLQCPFFRLPDVQRVVLHPAGLGVDLTKGVLSAGDNLPRLIEQDRAGTGGALVQGGDKRLHGKTSCGNFTRCVLSWLYCGQYSTKGSEAPW
ncbi:hypothetical protein SDC9_158667 [bioreactor metagenome]|uniref:Uncharacterized protein n=1 Tax=bioreactor metagenome TaxID=1076179 RepID=A0A645FCK3_9ZZZZ